MIAQLLRPAASRNNAKASESAKPVNASAIAFGRCDMGLAPNHLHASVRQKPVLVSVHPASDGAGRNGEGQAAASLSTPRIQEDYERLAATMRLVKAARFNAAERLERKATVSLFTQSTVALYFVGLAVWQAVYAAQIDEVTGRLLTFIQLVASVFTLILALLEALCDHKMRAHHLHTCALGVAELAQELRIARDCDPAVLQDYRRRYNALLRCCPVNHNRIDYLFAKLDGKSSRAAWTGVYARYLVDVYGLYAIFLTVPPLLWWLHA